MTARIAVVQFPGSNCEYDVVEALRAMGAEASIVWHGDRHLSAHGVDAAAAAAAADALDAVDGVDAAGAVGALDGLTPWMLRTAWTLSTLWTPWMPWCCPAALRTGTICGRGPSLVFLPL